MAKNRHPYDAEPATLLRALGGAASTAAFQGTALSLNALDEANWHNGEVPYQSFVAVVHVEAITGETTLTVEVADSADFTGAVVVGTLKPVNVGQHVIGLDGPTIESVNPGAKFIRIVGDVAAAASIQFGAWLAPVSGQPV